MFGRGHGHGGVPPHPPPPPPSTIEQLLAVQTQLMQALVQRIIQSVEHRVTSVVNS